MTKRWRTQLKKDPRVIALRKWYWGTWRKLATDKDFLIESARLKIGLEKAYDDVQNRLIIDVFFKRFSRPTGIHLRKVNIFLGTLRDRRLRALLRTYVQYVARFNVVIYVRTKKPHFRVAALAPKGIKFHCRISNGQIAPRQQPLDEDSYETLFDADIQAPAGLQRMIDSGSAKFLLIEDREGGSAINELRSYCIPPERTYCGGPQS